MLTIVRSADKIIIGTGLTYTTLYSTVVVAYCTAYRERKREKERKRKREGLDGNCK